MTNDLVPAVLPLFFVEPPILEHLHRLGVVLPADGQLHRVRPRRDSSRAAAATASTAAPRFGRGCARRVDGTGRTSTTTAATAATAASTSDQRRIQRPANT